MKCPTLHSQTVVLQLENKIFSSVIKFNVAVFYRNNLKPIHITDMNFGIRKL